MSLKTGDFRRRIMILFEQVREESDITGEWLSAEFWTWRLNSMEPINTSTSLAYDVAYFNKYIPHMYPSIDDVSCTNQSAAVRVKFGNKYYYQVHRKEFSIPILSRPWADAVDNFCSSRMHSYSTKLQSRHISTEINSNLAITQQKLTTPLTTTTSQRKRKQREISPRYASSPIKKRQLFTREIYTPPLPSKNDINIERGLLAASNIRKKAAAPAEKRANVLEKNNKRLQNRIKKVQQENIELKSSMARLVEKINRLRTEEQQEMYRDGLDGDLDENIKSSTWKTNETRKCLLLNELASVLKSHLSNEQKAVKIMKGVLKTLKMKNIAEGLVKPVVRSVFVPWKIGKYK
jgi:hypothetical protein